MIKISTECSRDCCD